MMHASDTVCSNRVLKQIKDAKLQVGKVSSLHCDPLLCLKNRDKKDVFMKTIQHEESVVPIPKHRGQQSENAVAPTKPRCITGYGANVGSVDKHDQMFQSYSIARKTVTWNKKLTFHLPHVALLNSCILYQDGCDGTVLKFQLDVVASFLFEDETTSEKAEKSEILCRLIECHFSDTL